MIKTQENLLQTLVIEIQLIGREVNRIETQILEIQETINFEQENLDLLKKEYAKMIYSFFIKKGSRNDLMFIISAKDFNQAYKRITHLKQYTFFRKTQVKKISQIQLMLEEKKKEIKIKKNELINEVSLKSNLIYLKEKRIKSINVAKLEKQELVNSLSKSEKLFRKKIEEQHKKSKELDDKIRRIIEEEIRKSREKYKNNSSGTEYMLTPEAAILSKEFVSNKGNLPWPLSKGVIVQYYGKQTHPVFSSVETFNNGIDIATDKNALVRTVFDGVVSRIFFIKGSGKAILINHGEYFSVYSGLEEVLSKEKIATVLWQESENKTELHFEIWKGYEKQDPSQWLFNAY